MRPSQSHRVSQSDSGSNPFKTESDAPEIEAWVESVGAWLFSEGSDPKSLSAPDANFWSFFLIENILDALDQVAQSSALPQSSNESGSEEGSNEANTTNEESKPSLDPLPKRLRFLLSHWSGWALRALQDAAVEENVNLENAFYQQLTRLYVKLQRCNMPTVEGGVLQCLSWNRSSTGLRLLTDLLISNPPHDWSATAIAISPLMRANNWSLQDIFPKIFEAQHPTTIATIIDLSNFVTRQGMAENHPGLIKKVEWTSLLGGVVSRLGLLEESPNKFGDTVAQVQHVLGESVALCVALCDAMGWFGDQSAIGKLNQALQLSHRRVQTEAAAALAKLGDEEGTKALIALAAQPSARLRVLAYAEELQLMDRIDPQWNTSEARAEAELALWLAQPPQFGLPPTEMECIDQRSLYWPGYDLPQDCFLFRYSYKMGDAELSNVGIAGPMVHSFAADLANLPDDDIYAAFAGWCAEHEDIYEVEAQHFNPAQVNEAKRLAAHMESDDLSEIRPLYLGFFVGERALIALAQKNQRDGIAVTDGLELLWYQTDGRVRPLSHLEAYSIFKGRKILRTYNAGRDEE